MCTSDEKCRGASFCPAGCVCVETAHDGRTDGRLSDDATEIRGRFAAEKTADTSLSAAAERRQDVGVAAPCSSTETAGRHVELGAGWMPTGRQLGAPWRCPRVECRCHHRHSPSHVLVTQQPRARRLVGNGPHHPANRPKFNPKSLLQPLLLLRSWQGRVQSHPTLAHPTLSVSLATPLPPLRASCHRAWLRQRVGETATPAQQAASSHQSHPPSRRPPPTPLPCDRPGTSLSPPARQPPPAIRLPRSRLFASKTAAPTARTGGRIWRGPTRTASQ